MNGRFEYAIRYQAVVTCLKPFRTGGKNRDSQSILLHRDGVPFLQGSSLAGALKSWKNNEALFGASSEQNGKTGSTEGSVIVSDLEFEPNAATVMRPRVRINEKNGTAAHNSEGKFDVMHLQTGTKGTFELLWCGKKCEADDVKQQMEEYLSALNQGLICLGGQKSNGFGRVQVQAQRRQYNMTNSNDRTAWIMNSMDGSETVELRPVRDDRIILHVTARTNSLLVKGQTPGGYGEGSVKAAQMKENDKYVIPGSSLKGAIKAQAKRIAPFLNISDTQLESLFGREIRKANGPSDSGIAGKITFSDAVFDDKAKRTAVPRIHINRFTGGTIRQGLFTGEVIGGKCEWDIIIPKWKAQKTKEQQTGALLVLYALRDLGIGLYSLGSENAVGRGRIEFLQIDIQTENGSAFIKCRENEVTVQDENGILTAWQQMGGDEP